MADYHGRFMTAGDPDLRHAIRTAGREQPFARGEKIQAASTSAHDRPILVIKSGFLSTVATAGSGQGTLLSIHGPGDLAAEHALFDNPSEARELAMTGMTQGSAWSVHPDSFRQILHDHPQRWETLARHLHDRAAAAEKRICLMAGETADHRLAVFIVQLLSYNNVPRARGADAQRVPLPLSQTELAEWIGASRETVERVLSRWAQRGIVETGRRYLFVWDVPKLEKIAGIDRDKAEHAAQVQRRHRWVSNSKAALYTIATAALVILMSAKMPASNHLAMHN